MRKAYNEINPVAAFRGEVDSYFSTSFVMFRDVKLFHSEDIGLGTSNYQCAALLLGRWVKSKAKVGRLRKGGITLGWSGGQDIQSYRSIVKTET